MTNSAVPGRLRQAVVVLAVLAGLFGMHGLMSGHGALASPANMVMSGTAGLGAGPQSFGTGTLGEAAPGTAATVAEATLHDQADMTLAMAAGSLSLRAPGSPMTGMQIACVAILPGGLLLGLFVCLCRRHVTPRRERSALPTDSGRPAWVPRLPAPPDLVAGLCVSRT